MVFLSDSIPTTWCLIISNQIYSHVQGPLFFFHNDYHFSVDWYSEAPTSSSTKPIKSEGRTFNPALRLSLRTKLIRIYNIHELFINSLILNEIYFLPHLSGDPMITLKIIAIIYNNESYHSFNQLFMRSFERNLGFI